MKELKWLAEYVVEFSDMSDFSKDITKDFISEADDTQVMKLLLDGELSVNVRNKKQLITEFKDSKFMTLLEQASTSEVPPSATEKRKTVMSVVGLTPLGLGIVGWPVYRAIRAAFDKCSRQCGTFHINTPTRQRCMAKCKEDMNEKVLNLKAKIAKSKKK